MSNEETIRETGFYLSQIDKLQARVKSLEFDNAELQKRDAEVTKKIQEFTKTAFFKYRNKRG